MASIATLRSRRSAAQLHALAGVQRQIRATDPNIRRKYLVDFGEAFRSYDSVLNSEKLKELLGQADIILVGDYHALPRSQQFASSLLESLGRVGSDLEDSAGAVISETNANAPREIVLGLETVFSRDQHILNEWMRDEIEEAELRERIRFDVDWGYEWEPFYSLLKSARNNVSHIYGLDCMPREDLRKIGARDRHAAAKIAEMRQRHPDALIVVLFGESHLAPNHLPRLLYERLRTDRVLTVLQNVDALYWRAAGESCDKVDAVQVTDDVVCVFNATPLEKYESYRLCLDRWGREGLGNPDLRPTIYNLIDGLVRFFGMDAYSPHNTTQPRFLVDSLPEVYCRTGDAILRKLLSSKALDPLSRKSAMQQFEEYGSVYLPHVNAFYIREFDMMHASEQAARFLHQACRGLPALNAVDKESTEGGAADRFYTRALEHALAYFGSRVLYPARPAVRESELFALYDETADDIHQQLSVSVGEFTELLDFLVLHRGYELNPARYMDIPQQVLEGLEYGGERLEYATRQLGTLLGSDLYDAYLEGRVTRRYLKTLLLLHLQNPGVAPEAYFSLVAKVRPEKKRPRSVKN